jgi:hypothetical protein
VLSPIRLRCPVAGHFALSHSRESGSVEHTRAPLAHALSAVSVLILVLYPPVWQQGENPEWTSLLEVEG